MILRKEWVRKQSKQFNYSKIKGFDNLIEGVTQAFGVFRTLLGLYLVHGCTIRKLKLNSYEEESGSPKVENC